MKALFLFSILLLSVCEPSFALTTDTTLSESMALRFNKTDYSFTVVWQEGPQRGKSRFIMKTWTKDAGTLNGPYQDLSKNLHVFLWMPSMGHGSAPVKIKKIADGEYEVSEVQFIMGGKWEIRLQLNDGAQVFDEAIVTLSL
jgi:hypothetical protein